MKEFAELAFREAGFTSIQWHGEGIEEKLIDLSSSKVLVSIDPQFFRPGEVPFLRGNSDKIKQALGW